MDPIWIAVIAFVIVAVVLGVLWRGSTLDKLEALPGEEQRFEEWRVRVKQVGGRTPTLHLSCCVRVTDRRLIIASKMLLSRRHVLLHVLDLDGKEPGVDLGQTLRGGYVRGAVQRKRLALGQEDERRFVEVPLEWLGQRLRLYCQEVEACLSALQAAGTASNRSAAHDEGKA